MPEPDASSDVAVAAATALIRDALAASTHRPQVKVFFDEATFTVSYVVRDPGSSACAIINSVLDYDAASGRTAALKRRSTACKRWTGRSSRPTGRTFPRPISRSTDSPTTRLVLPCSGTANERSPG